MHTYHIDRCMSKSKVVPFNDPLSDPSKCLEHVRELAIDTSNLSFDAPHFQKRMSERGITMRQVLSTIRKGELVDGPKKDDHGDWRIKIRRRVAGRKTQVVLVVRQKICKGVTVI